MVKLLSTIVFLIIFVAIVQCQDKDANATSLVIPCNIQLSKPEFYIDDICPIAKDGKQMLMIGQFKENAGPRTACVSISCY